MAMQRQGLRDRRKKTGTYMYRRGAREVIKNRASLVEEVRQNPVQNT